MLVVAACDIDEDKAKKIGEQFNDTYYTDMDEMMQGISMCVCTYGEWISAKHVIKSCKI